MCDTCPPPVTINVQAKPMSRVPSRCGSRTSVNGGRRSGGGRPASGCGSQRNVRNSNSLTAVACMQPPPQNQCCNHPRPDCCRVPRCPAPLPKCPQGTYVERVEPIRPDRTYIPPSIPFDALSSYREHYHLKCMDRAQSFKPTSTFDPSQAKMEGLSSYREAYTPKPLLSYQKPPWAKKAQFEPSEAKMEGCSTYRVDYKGCMGEKVTSLKPLSTFDPSTAKMDGLTTYRYNYIPYCPIEYQWAKPPIISQKASPGFSCSPMDGVTTYRGDFWPKCAAKRQSLKPNSKASFSTAPFADRTTYRNDYNPFHFEKCVGQCIPAECYDQMFPDPNLFSCIPDKREQKVDEDPCPPNPGCCPRGAIKYPGSCGNEMGLFPGPVPECCQLDDPPQNEAGDC